MASSLAAMTTSGCDRLVAINRSMWTRPAAPAPGRRLPSPLRKEPVGAPYSPVLEEAWPPRPKSSARPPPDWRPSSAVARRRIA
eukprot:10989638-Lingulodinium_polyedra.AAC.1